jgi:hypothetical protein
VGAVIQPGSSNEASAEGLCACETSTSIAFNSMPWYTQAWSVDSVVLPGNTDVSCDTTCARMDAGCVPDHCPSGSTSCACAFNPGLYRGLAPGASNTATNGRCACGYVDNPVPVPDLTIALSGNNGTASCWRFCNSTEFYTATDIANIKQLGYTSGYSDDAELTGTTCACDLDASSYAQFNTLVDMAQPSLPVNYAQTVTVPCETICAAPAPAGTVGGPYLTFLRNGNNENQPMVTDTGCVCKTTTDAPPTGSAALSRISFSACTSSMLATDGPEVCGLMCGLFSAPGSSQMLLNQALSKYGYPPIQGTSSGVCWTG